MWSFGNLLQLLAILNLSLKYLRISSVSLNTEYETLQLQNFKSNVSIFFRKEKFQNSSTMFPFKALCRAPLKDSFYKKMLKILCFYFQGTSWRDMPPCSQRAHKTMHNVLQLKLNANLETMQRMQRKMKKFGTKRECVSEIKLSIPGFYPVLIPFSTTKKMGLTHYYTCQNLAI